MNIILIGYRGTGKSACGRIIAEKLKMRLVSTDEEIVKKVGMTISAFVEENGWVKFRDAETQIVRKVSKLDNCVVDCGGGIIERDENIPLLKKNGKVFWFTASVDTIVKRIKRSKERPSLTGKSFVEEVAEVLERRNPKYGAAADYIIKTDKLTVEEQAREVIKRL
ncbi:MAG TPA: shikimate kinase [Candidatus Nanoarchaeia archaeon]|nr:shikimate kinase [Candidatus Nanoarchaeia archaeon]